MTVQKPKKRGRLIDRLGAELARAEALLEAIAPDRQELAVRRVKNARNKYEAEIKRMVKRSIKKPRAPKKPRSDPQRQSR